jgi:hypothetical protein
MTIIDKRPEQIKMEFALWSRPAVRELIERDLGLKLSVRAVGDYLARWGFTPQKPIKKAYEQRPEAVQAWLEDEYPAIEARAKREGAEIHWGDETALVNTDVRGRSYAPAGQTPVTRAVGNYDYLATGAPYAVAVDRGGTLEALPTLLESARQLAKRRLIVALDMPLTTEELARLYKHTDRLIAVADTTPV